MVYFAIMVLGWFNKKSATDAKGAKPAGEAAKNIKLSSLLSDDLIVRIDAKIGKEQLIETLVTQLCEARSLGDPKPYLAKVLEREQGISTTLDTGLAVPHARMDNLPDIAAVLALVPAGMADPKQPDLVIRAMFLFFSPNRKDCFTQHLHLLRGVSSLFQPEFIEDVLKADDSSAVHQMIVTKESTA
jgi:PTS system nitrogen regulatory IIA component